MKRLVFVLICVCLAGSIPSFADETIVYQNDYNDRTPDDAFDEGEPWSWIDGDTANGFVKNHAATYQDDGTGNIVVNHNGTIDNSAGTTAVDTRFGTQWGLTISGNTSPNPEDYIIEFDLRSVSGDWDPIALEFYVLTNNNGYGSGVTDYNQADGWVHVEYNLADLNVGWYAGTDWDLTLPDWRIELGGPGWPGTSVPAGTPAWDQIWIMDNLKITQISEPDKSYDPSPQDEAVRVDIEPTFTWTPGVNADKHDIYLGTDFGDVNDANRTNPMDVLVEQNLDANSYDPNTLQYETTYYWRVDDVNDPNIYKGTVWSFTVVEQYLAEIIIYESDFNDFQGGMGWNWIDGDTANGFVKSHTATYQDDGTGNIVVDHNALIDNSAGTTAVDCRFGSKWTIITNGGNISPNPEDYTIEFDLRSVSGNWDPMNLQLFVLTGTGNGLGYGTGASGYEIADGWVHVKINLADLNIGWYAGTDWDLTDTTWQIELGGPPWPGTSIPAGTPAWNQIWQMDNLKITETIVLTSDNPYPPNGATSVRLDPTFTWNPGASAVTHDVYLGTDFNDVDDANRTNPLGVLKAQNIDANSYDPNILQFETTYYWRIDDVNDPNVYKGIVWTFTTRDISLIDDFESYRSSDLDPTESYDLRLVWIDGQWDYEYPPPLQQPHPGSSGGFVQLATDKYDVWDAEFGANYEHYQPASTVRNGSDSMKFYFDNDGTVQWQYNLYPDEHNDDLYIYPAPEYSEVRAAIVDEGIIDAGEGQQSLKMINDWSEYETMMVSFYGDSNNTGMTADDKLYVTLADDDVDDVNAQIQSYPDVDSLSEEWWHDWYIPMTAFTTANGDLDMEDIYRIHIGVGNRVTQPGGGTGLIFLDDVQLYSTSVCIAGTVDEDFTGDCEVDNADLDMMTGIWLNDVTTTPVIEIDASELSSGAITSPIANQGSYDCNFVDFDDDDSNDNPVVEMVDGEQCITFDANQLLISDANAPDSITGPGPFTVVYKVYNPEYADDEEVFNWAKRGTTNRYASVCIGSSAIYGAGAFWTDGDIGFNQLPDAGEWHEIVMIYEGRTDGMLYVWVDNHLDNSDAKNLDIWPDCPMMLGAAYDGDPYVDAIPDGLTPGYKFTGSLAYLAVYDYAVPIWELNDWSIGDAIPANPINLYDSDSVIDFKDLALMGLKWMETPTIGD